MRSNSRAKGLVMAVRGGGGGMGRGDYVANEKEVQFDSKCIDFSDMNCLFRVCRKL